MNFKETLSGLDMTIGSLKQQKEDLITQTQASCSHPVDELLDARYIPSDYGYSTPPFRVCKLCGLAEQGWHCGYWKLDTREEVPEVSRKKANNYVLRFYTQEELTKLRFNR